jgi:membrane-associated phospholipid phosphatase
VSGIVTSTRNPAVPLPLRTPLVAMAATSALVVVLLGVLVHGDSSAGDPDARVMAAIETLWPDPGLVALIIDGTSEPVGAATLVALLAALCLVLGRRRLAVLAVAGPGFSAVTTTALKPLVDRTIHGEHLAYPSGHTATATAIGLVVGLLLVDLLRASKSRLPGAPALLLVLAGAAAGTVMAVAQIALTAHYPTDTVGGFFTATAVVPAVALVIDGIVERRATRSVA